MYSLRLDADFGTELVHGALFAFGFASHTDLAAVVDHAMGEVNPLLLRQYLHEVLLDLRGIGVLGESEAFAEACDVRVDDDAGRHAEGSAQNDVGRFTTDAGEGDHSFDVAGKFAVVTLDDGLAGRFNVFGLVAEEARALDDLFQGFDRRGGQRFGIGPAAEEFGRYHVDAGIGALGRKDRCDEQLERRFVFQGTGDVGVIGPQVRDDAVGLSLSVSDL